MSDTPTENESGSEPTSSDGSTSTRSESGMSRDQEKIKRNSTEDIPSEFTPSELVERPELTYEKFEARDTYNVLPSCSGRGTETASVRGYNVERLASAVFNSTFRTGRYSPEAWFDAFTIGSKVTFRIESKSCIYRYPSGSYGRFRIWKHHHDKFTREAQNWYGDTHFLYFFLVYKTDSESVKEVGKLAAPVKDVDEVLDKWTVRDHPTMGERRARDISWNLLLKRLGVPKSVFRELPIVDLTDGFSSTSSDN